MLFPFLILCFVIPYGAAELTQAQKKEIVEAHNYYRRSVQPEAANMKMMEWSDCLEQVAYDYLKKCPGLRHNADRTSNALALGCEDSGYVGENLYWYSAPITNVSQPVTAWHSEYKDYNINWKSCSKACGYYTQVVWANSYQVGCAVVSCTAGRGGTYMLCNYAPGGNYYNQAPYKIGTSCSDCSLGFDSCNDGLCSKTPAFGIM